MDIKLKTLTPLWTGGVDGKVDRIRETGILGSLRWWYEAIVRGLGGKACDPSQSDCTFDADKYAKSNGKDERQRLRDARLCDVCQVFGATGWRRRFRLHIVEEVSNAPIAPTVCLNDRQYTTDKGEKHKPTWYFRDPTRSGKSKPNTPKQGFFTIQIQSLYSDFSPQVIAGLIQFIADWAALGAKPQMGFGVVEPVDDRIDTNPFYDWVIAVSGGNQDHDLPSLRDMFFARILPKKGQSFSEEDTFNLKYDLRQLFAGKQNGRLRHFVMGTVKGGRKAAKVKMSRPYEHEGKSTIRVWGWIPEIENVSRNGWDREKVVERIFNHLKTNYRLDVWREMNSARDTNTRIPNNDNGESFLRSLLGLKEE